jgi:putative chitinase
MDIDILMAATGAIRTNAAKFIDIIDNVIAEFNITNKAMFLAQIGHESGGLKYLREIWGPTPAQSRYEGRLDLGNIYPGDGVKYKGRGLLQVTGRANYTKVGKGLNLDLVNHPELLEEPINAVRSAAYFWVTNGLNGITDVQKATKRINGGYNGLIERTALYTKAVSLLA